MKLLTFKFFLLFIYLISSKVLYSIEQPNIKNLIIHKNYKILENFNFQSSKNENLTLDNFKGSLILINFWATWCAPCKEEMSSLDSLQINENLKNLKILPINISQESYEKALKFYEDINIKNLDIYFDENNALPNIFKLRGIPTTIFINKKGFEFGRAVGLIDFNDKKLIEWLKNYK